MTSRYQESLSFALPGHIVRTVQCMGWSGFVNGKLLAAAAGEFEVLITGDRNMQCQQSASQLPMSVVVLIVPNHKLESFFATGGQTARHLGHVARAYFYRAKSRKFAIYFIAACAIFYWATAQYDAIYLPCTARSHRMLCKRG